jgi:hypothetical protein
LSLSMAPDALPGFEAGMAAYAQRLPDRDAVSSVDE